MKQEDRDFQMSYDEDKTSRKENGRFGKRAKVDEIKMRNFTKGGIRRSKDGAFQLIKNSNSLEKDYESCKDWAAKEGYSDLLTESWLRGWC